MSRVLVNHLNVRAGPSTNSQKVAYYDAGQNIQEVQEIKDTSALMKVTLYLLMFQGIFLDQDQE